MIESVELGEEDWTSNFSHYESMLVTVSKSEGGDKDKHDYRRKDRDKSDIFWCKAYQRNTCNESSPHMAHLKPDEPPVPVMHCCAFCLQKDNKRVEHPESECTAKK